MEFKDIEKIDELYLQGLEDGIRKFAWWSNGKQYVGTCGTTLKEALEEARKEYLKKQQDHPEKYYS